MRVLVFLLSIFAVTTEFPLGKLGSRSHDCPRRLKGALRQTLKIKSSREFIP